MKIGKGDISIYKHTYITSNLSPMGVGRDNGTPIATVFTHLFRFINSHQSFHVCSSYKSLTLPLASPKFFYGIRGKQANESPDGKRSAPPKDTRNNRGVSHRSEIPPTTAHSTVLL
uniref:SFRICE_024218 n=1 Tax=Spodoptera frugiperda TaxID=7108 RepID=A0A2H1WQM1_SPOFR